MRKGRYNRTEQVCLLCFPLPGGSLSDIPASGLQTKKGPAGYSRFLRHTPGLLSNEDCQEYSTVYVRQIVEAVQDENFAVILHNCGNKGQCTQAMIDSGAAALHFGNAVNMVETLEQCPSDLIVMGNIDPVGILKQATSEEVYRITADLLSKTSQYKNFVISSGCDMPPLVPDANIKAFYQAIADFNTGK